MDLSTWPAIVAVATTAAIFLTLQFRRQTPTDLLFLAGLVFVTLCGVISPEEALAGFANPAIFTIAALLVVAGGLRTTGVLDWVGRKLLGRAETEGQALMRLIPATIAASAFLLNTAVVAMMMPVLVDWCRRRSISPSRVLLPLSYLTILGGVCTTIGTSTTLVVQGKLLDLQQQYASGDLAFANALEPFSLFEIGLVGLPCAVAGGLLLWLGGGRLLPNRIDVIEQLGEARREYLVEILVQGHCPLIGQTVEQAGLRRLPGLFLIEIDREGEILTPVTPQDVLHANDRLVFTGVVSTIVDLEKTPGLVPAADMTYEFHPAARRQRHLTEVVLSKSSPVIGQTVREGQFRQRYNAAVVAVHRNGVRLTNKVGDIRLEPGDTLLLQTRTEFLSSYRNHRDFYLVSSVDGAEPRQHNKAWVAACLAGLLLVWLVGASLLPKPDVMAPMRDGAAAESAPGATVSATTGRQTAWLGIASPALGALTIAVLMVGFRCMTASEARNAIDMSMLLTIAGALGLGKALTSSGAAHWIAQQVVAWADGNPWWLLLAVFLLAIAFTETITNNAVAAMLLPLAVAVAYQANVDPRPFIVAITLAASLSFLTPIGYQTNLMVMGPGGYRPSDYLRCGAPLTLLMLVVGMLLIPRFWPFLGA